MSAVSLRALPRVGPVPESTLVQLTQRFSATAQDYDRRAVFPHENFRILHEAGLLGLTVAQELGGRGAPLQEVLRVLFAVAKGEPSTALILYMTYGMYNGMFARTDRWPRELYEHKGARRAAALGLCMTPS